MSRRYLKHHKFVKVQVENFDNFMILFKNTRALKTVGEEPLSSFFTSIIELKLDSLTMFGSSKVNDLKVEYLCVIKF